MALARLFPATRAVSGLTSGDTVGVYVDVAATTSVGSLLTVNGTSIDSKQLAIDSSGLPQFMVPGVGGGDPPVRVYVRKVGASGAGSAVDPTPGERLRTYGGSSSSSTPTYPSVSTESLLTVKPDGSAGTKPFSTYARVDEPADIDGAWDFTTPPTVNGATVATDTSVAQVPLPGLDVDGKLYARLIDGTVVELAATIATPFSRHIGATLSGADGVNVNTWVDSGIAGRSLAVAGPGGANVFHYEADRSLRVTAAAFTQPTRLSAIAQQTVVMNLYEIQVLSTAWPLVMLTDNEDATVGASGGWVGFVVVGGTPKWRFHNQSNGTNQDFTINGIPFDGANAFLSSGRRVSVVKNGTTWTVYVNGAQEAQATMAGVTGNTLCLAGGNINDAAQSGFYGSYRVASIYAGDTVDAAVRAAQEAL